LSHDTGEEIKQFEWSTKGVGNILSAVNRHLSCSTSIDPEHLAGFRTMVKEWF